MVGGSPPPNVTWFFMDLALPDCPGAMVVIPTVVPCVMMDDMMMVMMVVVVVASEESAGQYSCRAVNSLGEIGYEVTLHLMTNISRSESLHAV